MSKAAYFVVIQTEKGEIKPSGRVCLHTQKGEPLSEESAFRCVETRKKAWPDEEYAVFLLTPVSNPKVSL